jgi:GAF domain-containing protein
MHDLHFQRDAIDGADFCLRLALEKLPSRFGVVYLYDIDRREFVVVAIRGSNPPAILLRRTPEAEPILSLAMRRRRAIILTGQDLDIHGPVIGQARNAMLAPVMQVGRFLGAIELVDPEDAVPFTELDANALSYMAEQYAEFVGTRGVVVDPERISAASATAHPQAR